MIRSSALSSSTFCHGDDATLTITTQPMIRAIVQKEIIKRHIRGEQIPSNLYHYLMQKVLNLKIIFKSNRLLMNGLSV